MNKLFIALVVLLASSCALFTEPDISDSEVFLIAPVNGLKTVVATHTFWWDYVNDADRYQLIIVSPSWDAVNTLIVDTNLSSNKFVATLPPGIYEWAVMAYNSSSSTQYYVNELTIDTALSLANQYIDVKTPSQNFNTNKKKVYFGWYLKDIADSYIFEIKTGSWQGDNYIPPVITTHDTLSLDLVEGKYAWGIQGRNNFSSSLVNTRELIVDFTPPSKPTITIPDTLKASEATITWNRPGISLSAMRDSVLISTDSANFFNYLEKEKVTANQELEFTDLSEGFYFLRIRTYDLAGNVGEPSSIQRFYVEE